MQFGAIRCPANDFHNAPVRGVPACRVPHCGRLIGELPSLSNADIDDTEALCHTQMVSHAGLSAIGVPMPGSGSGTLRSEPCTRLEGRRDARQRIRSNAVESREPHP